MSKIEKVFTALIEGVSFLGKWLLIGAWCLTAVSLTFGIAAWSLRWFLSLV